MSQLTKPSPIKEEEKQEQQPQGPQPQAPPLPPTTPSLSSQEHEPSEESPQAEEKRASGKEEDAHSSKERKTEEADSPGKARDKNRDTGLVLPPEPYVSRLLNDKTLQIRLLQGFLAYYDAKGVFPFSNQNSVQEFLTDCLQVAHVQLREFMEAVETLWLRYEMTAIAIGPNLQSLTLVDREIFLLSNRIWALQPEDDVDPVQNVPSIEDYKGKAVKIDDSVTVTDKGKDVKNVDCVAETEKWKGAKNGDSDQTEKKDNKGKEKIVLVFKRKEKKNKYVVLVKGKEEKPTGKESEKKAASQDLVQPWSNLDTDTRILNGLIDYFFTFSRYPFDNTKTMEDFVKERLRLDLSVTECMRIIKKLKRKFKKQARNMDVSLGPNLSPHAAQMYNLSELIWGKEDPDYDSEGELSDDNEEEAKEVPNLSPTFGSEDLDRELAMYGFGCGEFKDLVPVTAQSTIMEDPNAWLRSIMGPYSPASLRNDSKLEEKEKETVHGDDAKPAGAMDKDDPLSSPAAPMGRDDPGEPHDRGVGESTDKQTSSQEEGKDR